MKCPWCGRQMINKTTFWSLSEVFECPVCKVYNKYARIHPKEKCKSSLTPWNKIGNWYEEN